MKALDEGKTEEAIKALELATGKMALIIARDPDTFLNRVFLILNNTFDIIKIIVCINSIKNNFTGVKKYELRKI